MTLVEDIGRPAYDVAFDLLGQSITLTPATAVKAERGDGSADYSAAPDRPPQVFILRNLAKKQPDKRRADDGGTTRQVPYLLTGRWNCEVTVGDSWDTPAAVFKVESVDASSGFKVDCNVTAYRKGVGHG